MLFGERVLKALHRLHNGLDAADAVLTVSAGEGPRAKVELVRVLLPFVKQTAVYLCVVDVENLGLAALGTSLDRSPGCTISGPEGVVVLAEGMVAAERVVLSSSPGRARADVQIEGERPRFLRNMPVEEGSPACVVVADASGDLRPGATATVLDSRP